MIIVTLGDININSSMCINGIKQSLSDSSGHPPESVITQAGLKLSMEC